MATSKLDILLDAIWKGGQATSQAKRDLEGVEKGAKKGGVSIGELTQAAGIAAAAVGGFAFAAKQAFDLGREGAAITQLEESFDRMNEAVFKTPDLLDRMSAAARGTIKDVDLMKGLLTLTAGASNEMSREFAGAAPKLLEIAKAANKLNPTLGDTAFLYDSIALGIKRGSPMILDNLGIVVKLGQANEDYAKALGKTVEQLSTEEKTMALLNEVMRSGDTLIQQVGGNVDAATDSYDQLAVAFGTVTDEGKQMIAQVLGPMVGFLADSIAGSRELRLAMNELAGGDAFETMVAGIQSRNTGISAIQAQRMAATRIMNAARGSGTGLDIGGQGRMPWEDLRLMMQQAAPAAAAIDEVNESLALQIKLAMKATIDTKNYSGSLREVWDAAKDAAEAHRDLVSAQGDYFTEAIDSEKATIDLERALFDAADAAGAGASVLAELALATGDFTDAEIDAALKAAAMRTKIEELGALIAEGMGIPEALEELRTFNDELLALDGMEAVATVDVDITAAEGKLDFISRKIAELMNGPDLPDMDDLPETPEEKTGDPKPDGNSSTSFTASSTTTGSGTDDEGPYKVVVHNHTAEAAAVTNAWIDIQRRRNLDRSMSI